ncbi:MAG: glycoside hydrolase family 9 protein [Fibrobacteria bacterium]|nr:glycoside hydrolase family 9 protein [Fibrobacteria bacterium]
MKPIHTLLTATSLLVGFAAPVLAAPKFTPADYQRALWMATRFYGGQRSGAGPNWLSLGLPDSLQKSFTRDAYQGADVSGGWFDCGDHVMFGQTQYWASYMLAKAYETFPTGYDDLYNGVDYSGYQKSGNWNDLTGGEPNGIPDLVDELVYEADYIAKAVLSSNALITLKGDPDADHKRWVTPGMMTKMNKTLGGECSSGGEEIYEAPNWKFLGNLTPCSGMESRSIKADKDKAMASNAAAALATISRILSKLDIYPERAKLYAEKAVQAYDHASAISGTIAYGIFYGANPNQWDDFVNASIELYKLTGDSKYLDNAKSNEGKINKEHNWALNYNNADDVAFFNMAEFGGSQNALTALRNYASYYKSKINSEGLSEVGDPGWGTLRYPLGGAFSMALTDAATNESTFEENVLQQVDFVLGANNAKISFIVGFKSSLTSISPSFPHHRGIFQRNDNPSDEDKKKMVIPEKNRSHGSLVANLGFPSTGFKDDVVEYKYSEVCTDYNVGLVGALGYIVSKLAPVDTSKFGRATAVQPRRVQAPALRALATAQGITFQTEGAASTLEVRSASGRAVWSSSIDNGQATWTGPAAPGLYVAMARTPDGSTSVVRFLRD